MIAIVIGHRAGAQGTTNVDGVSEWHWNGPLAALVVSELLDRGIDARLVYRPDHPGGYAEQAAQLNLMRPPLAGIVELHFNSVTSPRATGTETLCHPCSTRGGTLAEAVQRHMVACLGLRDRGVKGTLTNASGVELLTITRTKAPAIIVESHFGSNPHDAEVATARRPALAAAIAEGIEEWSP